MGQGLPIEESPNAPRRQKIRTSQERDSSGGRSVGFGYLEESQAALGLPPGFLNSERFRCF